MCLKQNTSEIGPYIKALGLVSLFQTSALHLKATMSNDTKGTTDSTENKGEQSCHEKVSETLKKVGVAVTEKMKDDKLEVNEDDMDLLSKPAMNNAYFVCHNVQVNIKHFISCSYFCF